MNNYDFYQEEMLIAAMTGSRCKFIKEHSGAECVERKTSGMPACEVCTQTFKRWLLEEYKPDEKNNDIQNAMIKKLNSIISDYCLSATEENKEFVQGAVYGMNIAIGVIKNENKKLTGEKANDCRLHTCKGMR